MILVDQLRTYQVTSPLREKRWCHMVSDHSEDELHLFAIWMLKMRRSWYQLTRLPHYDLMPGRRAMAVQLGAIEVGSKELVKRHWLRR